MIKGLTLNQVEMVLIAESVNVYNKLSKQRMFIDALSDDINVREFKVFQKQLDDLDKKLTKVRKQIMKGNHGTKI